MRMGEAPAGPFIKGRIVRFFLNAELTIECASQRPTHNLRLIDDCHCHPLIRDGAFTMINTKVRRTCWRHDAPAWASHRSYFC